MKKLLSVFLSAQLAFAPTLLKAGDAKNQEETRLQERIKSDVKRIDETLAKKNIKLQDNQGNQIDLAEAAKQEQFIVNMEDRGDGKLEVRRLEKAKDKITLAVKNLINNSATLVTIDFDKSAEENIQSIKQSLSIIFPKVLKNVLDNPAMYIGAGVILVIGGFAYSFDDLLTPRPNIKAIERSDRIQSASKLTMKVGAGIAAGTFLLWTGDMLLTEYVK